MIELISQLWTWWLGQLSDALPTLSTARRRAAIVAYQDGHSLCLRDRGMPYADLGFIDLRVPRAGNRSAPIKPASVGGRNRRVALHLPEESGVRRRLSLPLAAEAHLPAIVANELDRLTPWRPEQAIFSAAVMASSAETGLDVEVRAVPRFAFAAIAQSLRDARLELIGVLLEHPERAPDFIAIEPDTTSAKATYRRPAILSASLGILIVLILAIAFGQKFWAIHDLQIHMQRLETDARKVQAMQIELGKLSDRTYYAVNMKRKAPSAIVTLEVLSRLLPDDCWLDSVTLSGNQLTLVGHARDALALLPLLTTSGFFNDAHFDSEVMRDVEADIQGFSITATVIPHAAP